MEYEELPREVTGGLRIDGSVGVENCEFPFFATDRIAVFHSKNTRISLALNKAEDIVVIDFTRAGFLPSGVVANLEISDLIPACFNVWDQVSFLNLLVVDIE